MFTSSCLRVQKKLEKKGGMQTEIDRSVTIGDSDFILHAGKVSSRTLQDSW